MRLQSSLSFHRSEKLFSELLSKNDLESNSSSIGIRFLCPTRWTVHADSLFDILENYSALMHTWDEAISVARDTESKARIYGVQAQMKKFSFLFGVYLAELVLRHTDNLSKALQCDTVSAAEAQDTAAMVVRTLQTLRNEEAFDLFWELKVNNSAEAFKVEQPELPRKRRIPNWFDDGIGEHEYHSEPKTYDRQEYYEALELSVGCIKDRFYQPGYLVYCHLQNLLLKASQRKDFQEDFEFVCSFYKDDLHPEILRSQLSIFCTEFQKFYSTVQIPPTIVDIIKYTSTLTAAQKQLLSEVCTVMKLTLVMPATNATSERTFSALCRIKSYLRSTMSQVRLNHLMVLQFTKLSLTASS